MVGLVADCGLTNFVSNSCSPHTTANDGLWTSLVLGSELFRYHVTQSSDAQEKFLRQFAGMKFLNDVSAVSIYCRISCTWMCMKQVTGIPGLMARSVVRDSVAVSGGIWYESTTKLGWKWNADTSSDEASALVQVGPSCVCHADGLWHPGGWPHVCLTIDLQPAAESLHQ